MSKKNECICGRKKVFIIKEVECWNYIFVCFEGVIGEKCFFNWCRKIREEMKEKKFVVEGNMCLEELGVICGMIDNVVREDEG